jgi:hypothetical protein
MINEKDALRLYVRKAIRLYKENKKQQELLEEQKFRQLIRGLILKEKAEDQPKHDSTGINVLEDLLKKIIPQLQTDYKILTTDASQRQSFRAHILNAVQNALSPELMYALSDKEAEPLKEEKASIVVDNPDMSKFIDIEDKQEEEEEITPEEQFSKGLEDQNLDTTGRNMAMDSFKKMENQIVDAYSLLDNEKDRGLFYDYLITNLKLYFDKFEEEMNPTTTEPTTPEYEEEKNRKAQEDQGGGESPITSEPEPTEMT